MGTIIEFIDLNLLGYLHESLGEGSQTWDQLQSPCFVGDSWCPEFHR